MEEGKKGPDSQSIKTDPLSVTEKPAEVRSFGLRARPVSLRLIYKMENALSSLLLTATSSQCEAQTGPFENDIALGLGIQERQGRFFGGGMRTFFCPLGPERMPLTLTQCKDPIAVEQPLLIHGGYVPRPPVGA